jgi:hypothetical protein
MPTARPFAYNPGATGPIPGTEQIGDLAIGVDPLELRWRCRWSEVVEWSR